MAREGVEGVIAQCGRRGRCSVTEMLNRSPGTGRAGDDGRPGAAWQRPRTPKEGKGERQAGAPLTTSPARTSVRRQLFFSGLFPLSPAHAGGCVERTTETARLAGWRRPWQCSGAALLRCGAPALRAPVFRVPLEAAEPLSDEMRCTALLLPVQSTRCALPKRSPGFDSCADRGSESQQQPVLLPPRASLPLLPKLLASSLWPAWPPHSGPRRAAPRSAGEVPVFRKPLATPHPRPRGPSVYVHNHLLYDGWRRSPPRTRERTRTRHRAQQHDEQVAVHELHAPCPRRRQCTRTDSVKRTNGAV